MTHSYCSRTCGRRWEVPSPICCELDGCCAAGKSAYGISAREDMQNTSLTSSYWITHKPECTREAVRPGEAEGCIKCGLHPRMLGRLCILFNHRFKTGLELRDLKLMTGRPWETSSTFWWTDERSSPILAMSAQSLSRWAALQEPAY